MGLEPSDDVGMMDAIRDNVKHLCRKDIVIASILLKSVDFQTYLDEFGEGTKQVTDLLLASLFKKTDSCHADVSFSLVCRKHNWWRTVKRVR